MKRLIVMLLVVVLLAACADTAAPQDIPQDPSDKTTDQVAGYQKISAEQAKEMMDETDGWILLDVRTQEEFQEEHIEGAILIPDYEIAGRAESEIPDKDTVILVYCRSGRRSADAANELVGMGYTNVYDFGGIADWPYDTVSG
jgi:Rhodanese-related sulfurtransferase